MKFNWLDIVYMVVAVRGLLVGARRGILGELVQSIIILSSILVAIFLSASVGTAISSFLPFGIKLSAEVTAWVIVVTGISLAFLLGKIIQKLSHLFIQSNFDKIVGGILGVFRAVVLTAAFLAFLILSPSEFFQKHVWESVVGLYAHERVTKIYDVIKEKIPSRQIEEIEQGVKAVSDDEVKSEE